MREILAVRNPNYLFLCTDALQEQQFEQLLSISDVVRPLVNLLSFRLVPHFSEAHLPLRVPTFSDSLGHQYAVVSCRVSEDAGLALF